MLSVCISFIVVGYFMPICVLVCFDIIRSISTIVSTLSSVVRVDALSIMCYCHVLLVMMKVWMMMIIS